MVRIDWLLTNWAYHLTNNAGNLRSTQKLKHITPAAGALLATKVHEIFTTMPEAHRKAIIKQYLDPHFESTGFEFYLRVAKQTIAERIK